MHTEYGSLKLTLTTLRTKLLGKPDLNRWEDLTNFDELWDERTQLIAGMIPAGSNVIEFGAGRRQLEKWLDKTCSYYPSDLVDRGPGTLVLDLNQRPSPDLTHLCLDYAVFGGVLEYLQDLPATLTWLATQVPNCIVSYECAETSPGSLSRMKEHFRRLRYGWVNTFSAKELEEAFGQVGYKKTNAVSWHTKWGDEEIYHFQLNTMKNRSAKGVESHDPADPEPG